MNGKVERLAMVLLPILVVAACPGFGDEEPAGLFEEVPDIVTYEDHISRLYEVRCDECHSNPPKLGAPGNFRLDNFKGAVDQIGLSNIRVGNPSNPMPPSSRPQLSDIERQVLLRWVECGTPERASQADCPDPNAAPSPTTPRPRV